MKGFIIYADYTTIENEEHVRLFGRLENGQSFVTLNKFHPYFYIRKKDKNKLNSDSIEKVEETQLKNFDREEVLKVTFKNKVDLNRVYKEFHKDISIYEADIKPHNRFLIDKNILSSVLIEGEYTSSDRIDRVYQEQKLSATSFNPDLKIVSIDTETSKSNSKLFCIGIYAENYSKNFMVTKHNLKNTVACKSEEDCLEKFKAELLKLDPDIIVGWNVIDFDLVYLKNLYRKYKMPFDLGRTSEEASLRIESNFFRSSKIDLPGRQVLDGLNLIRDPFIKEAPSIKNLDFESLSLESVAQAILKKGKLLKGKFRHEEIEELYKKNTPASQQKLADYNLLDCELVYDILKEKKIIELAVERSQLTGMPLDRITASVAAFDSVYIREARKAGLVSPSMEFKQKEERIKGGYVQASLPGVYKNVLVLDFKSLYPSIIRTFNIDPASYLEKKEKNAIESPNKAYFRDEEGILPRIIEKLHAARENAKKEKRELSSYAIKTIMNSFVGVLASQNCRYFDPSMANSTTHFGQFIIKLTAQEIEKKGFRVIYSDTDSCFVETNLGKEKANTLGIELQDFINKFYEDYVKKNYSRKSFLELQFDKQYLSLMIPKVRGETAGAKKRYAGLIEKNGREELEVVGLEAIRGDWTEAAQDFQKELLMKIFHDNPIEKFIRDYVKKIVEGKLDSKLIYRKSIRKSLEDYTKTTPPHVKAARKLDNIESNIIEYYITEDGPEPIQKLTHKIDYDHYIQKQIKPIANQILSFASKDFDTIIQGSKQSTLF